MSGEKPKIGLVLGAGSARGLAHIGVIQVLEEHNIPFDFIIGSSMGAMVGAIYSAGADIKMLDKMLEIMDTSMFFDFRVPRLGFIEGKRIKYFLDLMTKNKSFEDLNIPLVAIATDLISGESVLLDEGLVADAVRASISIPGIFKPVKRDDMILVDGAVANRLPIEVARDKGAQIVIAVEVNYTHSWDYTINNALDVILASLDIMQKPQFELISKKADILIKPEVGHFSPRDFDKSRQLVDLGRAAAEAKIEDIQKMIERFL